MDRFRLQIITPEHIFFDEEVFMIEFNTIEGEIGVYAQHIPLTCIVKPWKLNIHGDGEVKRAAMQSGFAEILPHQVTILTENVAWSG